MYQFVQDHQLNIMLGLSSICFVVGFFALITRSLSKKRKVALADIEFSASILLYFDRMAYIYHGDTSTMGYYMVRVSNFLVFFMTISVVHGLNLYIADLCKNEIGLDKVPMRLRIVELITGIGWLLVIVSQFTGLYYYFDENNAYQRGPGFIICYIIPFVALFIQLSVAFQYARKLSGFISIPMILFTVIPMVASVFQALFYGVSLTNMAIVGMGVVLYVFAIMEMNEKMEQVQKKELNEANIKHLSIRRSFEQVVTAFAKGLDQKSRFTKGHSLRVADYSRNIAMTMGLSDAECFRVYNAAILHDIGKMDLPDTILENRGRLTEAEENLFKSYPEIGGDLLSEVKELPYLQSAARYHNERYDGKGFPEGLKGEEIPLYARIVAVANEYDKMTSFTESREPLAQGKVREMLLSESGRKFDPAIVDIMVEMIDKDTDYMMREPEDENLEDSEKNDLNVVKSMHFDEYKDLVSDGIRISREYLKVSFKTRPDMGYERKKSIPAIILFDSFDRCVHKNERSIKNLRYFEYGEIWMDGHTISTEARDIRSDVTVFEDEEGIDENEWIEYEIETVANGDHVKIKISSPYRHADVTIALPDATRYVYFGIAGEHCSIRDVKIKQMSLGFEEPEIERIAPEVDFFTRKDGDIPNLEVDGYRESTTVGIPVEDGMRIFFRTESLPFADLVHHCAYIVLFYSDDGTVDGKNYMEYACIRMDGDDATHPSRKDIKLIVHKDDDFGGWDEWKKVNRIGLDYEVVFKRKKNRITFTTDNGGLSVECITMLPEGTEHVYAALTGNLCTLMNIRVR